MGRWMDTWEAGMPEWSLGNLGRWYVQCKMFNFSVYLKTLIMLGENRFREKKSDYFLNYFWNSQRVCPEDLVLPIALLSSAFLQSSFGSSYPDLLLPHPVPRLPALLCPFMFWLCLGLNTRLLVPRAGPSPRVTPNLNMSQRESWPWWPSSLAWPPGQAPLPLP